jgi:D-galactarolactone isomerase
MAATRPGACDTHMHFYDAAVPASEGGPPLPGHFTVADYRAWQAAHGFSRVVAVQPNAYQFDNRVLLAALQALGTHGDNARGVAVVRPETPDEEIAAMTRLGVRAQRFYALRWGALGLDDLGRFMPRLHEHGWHANVQLDGRTLPQWEDTFRRLPCDVVFDHVGKFLPPPPPSDPAFQCLLRLLDTGRCWVKLSAPYESSAQLHGTGARHGAALDDGAFGDVAALVRALVAHAPERLLWASNWPHPFPPAGFVPDDRSLLGFFHACVPDEAQRHRILVDNPARLYGFTDPPG